jgi:hypothetical protein
LIRAANGGSIANNFMTDGSGSGVQEFEG